MFVLGFEFQVFQFSGLAVLVLGFSFPASHSNDEPKLHTENSNPKTQN